MKTSTIVVVLVVLLAVLGGWYASGLPPFDTLQFGQEPQGVACTMDAMQCPDGSYVGRSGPNCEFVCPAATSIDTSVQVGLQATSTAWPTGSAQDDPGLGDGSAPQQ